MSYTFKTDVDGLGEVEVTCTLMPGEAPSWDCEGMSDECDIELVMKGGCPMYVGGLSEEQLQEISTAAFESAREEAEENQISDYLMDQC